MVMPYCTVDTNTPYNRYVPAPWWCHTAQGLPRVSLTLIDSASSPVLLQSGCVGVCGGGGGRGGEVWVIGVGKWLVATYVLIFACENHWGCGCGGGGGRGGDTWNF